MDLQRAAGVPHDGLLGKACKLLQFVLSLFCCSWGDVDRPIEHEHVPGDDVAFASASRHIRSRPLENVGESSALLQGHPNDCSKPSKLSPQEKQFKAMRKPSFTTSAFSGKSGDDETCAVCLEEFTADNPKTHLKCGHGFHLGCVLEWQERGHYGCPLCHVVVDSLDES